ncbi:hypothetical protein FRB99_003269 [Tulasnella sp. 403]|nr:hypothetical protein FRB99_003269 [Tulasnella sp. 403]
MEKYSTWRDAGTGIQPFLTPIPPVQTGFTWTKLYRPFGYLIGSLRLALMVIPLAIHATGSLLGVLLTPLPPIKRVVEWLFIAISARLALAMTGLWWIPVEIVSRKRGRSSGPESWNPAAGDIIVSNWSSWTETLWLAFRWNPIFVIPVYEKPPVPACLPTTPNVTPGRRTGTGSAAISSPSPSTSSKIRSPILGFKRTTLLGIINHTGRAPLLRSQLARGEDVFPLEAIRKMADRPVVVFPECTSSNGRALLRCADIFQDYSIPIRGFKLFLMCARYDPPTNASPTLSHSIPSNIPILPNPVLHLFTLLAAPTFSRTMSIRLLALSDSPSSATFVSSEFFAPGVKDLVGEACAQLIAQLGKTKRVSVLGWEDKVTFLDFYKVKTS